jgi:cytochrome d ubiquinol oxidase subunit I
MQELVNPVILSRLQFALTAMFHILWPVLTVGLSLFLVFMEALWLKTKHRHYYQQLRFWNRLFLINVAVGVVTGIPMEFQFGTNWSVFSTFGGDVFGHMLGFEATMAFMLEASFLGVMALGWNRVSRALHFFATCMVALGASLSAFWILAANSWMQTPAGGVFQGGGYVVSDNLAAIFNPDMPWGVSHMWVACLEITVFVVGGISAWHLKKKQHVPFFLRSFKTVAVAAIVITSLQIWLGDGSGLSIAKTQPSKVAGIEAHWKTNPPGEGAPWHIVAWPDIDKQDNVWDLSVPNLLSLLTTHSRTGQVPGLRDFPRKDQPPIVLPFYAFRIMVGIGFLLFFLMLWTLWAWRRGRLTAGETSKQKSLLFAWMAAVPLSYLAMEAGWVVREMGRQPWIIYGVLRTEHGATDIAPGPVIASLLVFAIVYLFLFLITMALCGRIIRQGPDLQ